MIEEEFLRGRGVAAHGAQALLAQDSKADQTIAPSRKQVEEVAVRVMSAQVAKHCRVSDETPGELLDLVSRIA